jgi:CRISPR-associated protein Cmr4
MPETVRKFSGALLALHAQTALHPGAGTALGTVDLPVQRERHTHWPTIAGSALKGILRDRCREKSKEKYHDEQDADGKVIRTRRRVANEDDAQLVAAFGPGKVDESSSHAGALSVTDARILAFPVRSLRGVFAWVTCPAVLERLSRDLTIAGLPELPDQDIPRPQKTPTEDQAACADKSPLLVDGDRLVLEEFEFRRVRDAGTVADWVASHAVSDTATQHRVRTHLTVLHDDDFTHFVRHATEIVARIALNYDTKTVAGTALFYQEFLPAETLLYSIVLASTSRSPGRPDSAAEVLNYLAGHLEPGTVLQVGGDETVGKGLCLVRLNGKGA